MSNNVTTGINVEVGILDLLENILGDSIKRSKGNYSFKCPKCKHHKHKLEINLEDNCKYHCWVCHFRGKSLQSLLKSLSINNEYVTNILQGYNILINNKQDKESKIEYILQLPKEFTLFFQEPKNKYQEIMERNFLKYLYNRGITDDDIFKYNLGYCIKGDFEDNIILPSYDIDGNLNYFIGKNIITDKYTNPPINRNIIGLEYFINWNLPIILVEGYFDAMSSRRNTIPLFGTKILPELMKRILSTDVDKIYICLDPDAILLSIEYCELLLQYGKQIYFVNLEDKDINELGFDNFLSIVENVYPITFRKLIELKLEQ